MQTCIVKLTWTLLQEETTRLAALFAWAVLGALYSKRKKGSLLMCATLQALRKCGIKIHFIACVFIAPKHCFCTPLPVPPFPYSTRAAAVAVAAAAW